MFNNSYLLDVQFNIYLWMFNNSYLLDVQFNIYWWMFNNSYLLDVQFNIFWMFIQQLVSNGCSTIQYLMDVQYLLDVQFFSYRLDVQFFSYRLDVQFDSYRIFFFYVLDERANLYSRCPNHQRTIQGMIVKLLLFVQNLCIYQSNRLESYGCYR